MSNFVYHDATKAILTISKSGITADPDVPVDEAARSLLAALESHIKHIVSEAVRDERAECAKVCDPYTHGQWFAKAIRARGAP